jgi:hypothetical protein
LPGAGRAALLVAAIVLTGALMGFGAYPLSASASGGQLALSPTVVYGLYRVEAPGLQGGTTVAEEDLGNAILFIGGVGYVAALNLTGGSIEWTASLQGTASLSAVDSTWNASAFAIATDEGEIVVYSPNGSELARYYLGEDEEVAGLALLRSPDGLKLAVETSGGYLRVYRVGSPYWLEIGPDPGEEPLRSLGGVKVEDIAPLQNYTDWWRLESASKLLVLYTIEDSTLYPTLTLDVSYLNGTQEEPAYVREAYDIGGGRLLFANLEVWPLVHPYGRPSQQAPGPYTGNASVTITNFYPGVYSFKIIYNVTIVNSTTGQVLESHCYGAETGPLLLPLESSLHESVVAVEGQDCTPPPEATAFNAYMILDAGGLPENFSIANISYLLAPSPQSQLKPSILRLVHSEHPPEGWADYNATGVLVEVFNIQDSGEARIVYLDSNLTPVPVNGTAAERMAFEAPLSSVSLSPGLERLYVGTDAGTLYLLRWLLSEGRYVASNSMEVTGDEAVVAVEPTPSNVDIAVGASGAAQAVSEEDWQPIWRGGPGYASIQLPLEGAQPLAVFSGPYTPLVVLPESLNGTPWLLSAGEGLWSTPPLSRLQVNVTVTLETLEGGVEAEQPGDGSVVEALLNGTVVASAPLGGDGVATLYLAPGNYTLLVNATSWGAALVNVTVGETDESLDVDLAFREVEVSAYTPTGPEPGYSLVAGPLQGAQVALEPTGLAQDAPYTPLAMVVNATTGEDGTVVATVWALVAYNVTVAHPGYYNTTLQLGPGGACNLSVAVYPILYNVTVSVEDSDAAGAGIAYSVGNASITITRGARSLTLQAPEGALTLGLPAGDYTIEASAPGYLAGSASISVGGQGGLNLTLLLEPQEYTVTVSVQVNDSLTGILSGPLEGAQVTLTLVDPPIPGASIILYTGAEGAITVQLRYGVYNVTVTHNYTETYTALVAVGQGQAAYQFTVRPRYASVTITVYDSQLRQIGFTAANASIAMTNTFSGKSASVTAPEGVAELTLPYGLYVLSISAPHYYPLSGLQAAVASSTVELEVELNPVFYQVILSVYLNDTLTGLASGPLPGALVEALLAQPEAPWVNATGYTDESGAVALSLRYGVYEVRITHPWASNTTLVIDVESSQSVTVAVSPLYASVHVSVYDSELSSYGVLAPNATLQMAYMQTGRSAAFRLPSGEGVVELPYGYYTIAVSAPYYYPSSPETVLVNAGTAALNFTLAPIHYQVTIAVGVNDTLTGLATGPLPGAQVVAELASPEAPGVNATTYTNQDGVATLSLHYGLYNVSITHPWAKPLTLQIRVDGERVVTVTLTPRYSQVSIDVLDSELYTYGVHVANASITLTYTPTGLSETLTLPEGSAVTMLPYGYYTYIVEAPFYYTSPQREILVDNESGAIVEYLAPLKYEVTLKFVIDDPLWGLANGPAAGALVNVSLVSPQLPLPPAADYSDSQGRVVFQLRAGTYRVSVTHPIAADAEFTLRVGAPVSVSYILNPAYANVSITVADSETGEPIPGAVLVLTYTSMGAGRSVTLTLDSGKGSYLLPPGSYQFEASEWHYYSGSGSFTLNKAGNASVGIHLQPVKVAITIAVESAPVSSGGISLPSRPLEGALVVLQPVDPVLQAVGAPAVTGVTSREGALEVEVRIGSYAASVLREHYVNLTQPVLVANARTIDFTLQPILYNLTLYIIDPDMLPGSDRLSGVALTITSWDGYPVGSTMNVSYGTVLHLPAGNYTIRLEKEYYQELVTSISVSGDTNATLQLRATLFTVTIGVQAEAGAFQGPVSGALLVLVSSLPLRNNVFAATLSSDGTAALQLRAGFYTIFISGPGVNESLRIGNITVPATLHETLKFAPPLINISISTVDALAPIPVNATLDVVYLGPYGSGKVSIESNGTAIVEAPPGRFTVTATAKYYKPFTLSISVTASNSTIRLELEPVLVPITVKVVDEDGKPVDGAVVRLVYEKPALSPPPMVTINGTAKAREGVRIGDYRVEVDPPPGSPLLPASAGLHVGGKGAEATIVLAFRNYTVTITLKDSITGKLIPFKYVVKLQRVGGSENVAYPRQVEVSGGKANLTLPYGTYTLTLQPAAQDYYIVPEGLSVNVERDGQEVVIQMNPRSYTVTVTVVNDRSRPVGGALVELVDTRTHATVASQLTDATGKASFTVTYGLYEVRVAHKDYKPATAYINVPSITSTTVNVYPTPVTALKRMSPLIVGVTGLALLGLVLWKAKETIAARLAEQEEYF